MKLRNILKNKGKRNSRLDFLLNRKQMLKSKRSQGVFGMSFTMLFSILLIVFFIAAAFIAIRFFLDFQKQAMIGQFYEELQFNIDKSWKGQSSSFTFSGVLPSKIRYVCFINISANVGLEASNIEKQIYQEISRGNYKNNIAMYPTEVAGGLSYNEMKNILLPEDNPYCISVENGKVEIKIEKDFSEALVSVS